MTWTGFAQYSMVSDAAVRRRSIEITVVAERQSDREYTVGE
jgi:hypothetical protein